MSTLSRRSMLYGSAATLGAATLASEALAQGRSASGLGATANAYPAPPAQGAIAQDTEWTYFSGDNLGHRYSPLDQINAANFKNLQVAWKVDSGKFGPRIENNWESVPLLIKGRLYITAGTRRDLICVDAVTGEQIWMYRLDEGKRGADSVRALSGRGASYWTDGKAERIIYVTPGYQLVSLDMNTGLPDPKFGVKGIVDLKKNDDQDMGDLDTATIALQATPIVANGVVIVGAAHTADTSPRDITKGVK